MRWGHSHECILIQERGSKAISQPTVLPKGAALPLPYHIAQILSQILSPPLVSAVCILLAASCLNRPNAWLWGGIHILLTAALPTLYIVYLYHRGWVSDPHLNVRSERFRPLVAALLTSSLPLGLLYSASAPRLLVLLAALNLIQLVLFLGITLRWKISAHCTAVASLAVLGFYLLGLASFWLLAIVPVVAWARIYLECHTPAQTMAGAVLGASLWMAGLFNFGF